MNAPNPFEMDNPMPALEDDPLPTDANHPNQTGIGEQTFIANTINPPPTIEEVPVVYEDAVVKEEPFKKKHHNIIDMYWLINDKLFQKKPLGEGEAGFIALGYNADFANLRVGFHQPDQESFTKSSMVKDKMKFMTSINLFSETAYNILDCLRTAKPINISNFERIVGADNSWTPNQTQITGNQEEIIIKTLTPNGEKYYYTFLAWQIPCFASALKYMVEGNSWNKYLDMRKA
jgi:hypothetical protein